MNISLDFDNTYTRDPYSWDQFIKMMSMAGRMMGSSILRVVVMRRPYI